MTITKYVDNWFDARLRLTLLKSYKPLLQKALISESAVDNLIKHFTIVNYDSRVVIWANLLSVRL